MSVCTDSVSKIINIMSGFKMNETSGVVLSNMVTNAIAEGKTPSQAMTDIMQSINQDTENIFGGSTFDSLSDDTKSVVLSDLTNLKGVISNVFSVVNNSFPDPARTKEKIFNTVRNMQLTHVQEKIKGLKDDTLNKIVETINTDNTNNDGLLAMALPLAQTKGIDFEMSDLLLAFAADNYNRVTEEDADSTNPDNKSSHAMFYYHFANRLTELFVNGQNFNTQNDETSFFDKSTRKFDLDTFEKSPMSIREVSIEARNALQESLDARGETVKLDATSKMLADGIVESVYTSLAEHEAERYQEGDFGTDYLQQRIVSGIIKNIESQIQDPRVRDVLVAGTNHIMTKFFRDMGSNTYTSQNIFTLENMLRGMGVSKVNTHYITNGFQSAFNSLLDHSQGGLLAGYRTQYISELGHNSNILNNTTVFAEAFDALAEIGIEKNPETSLSKRIKENPMANDLAKALPDLQKLAQKVHGFANLVDIIQGIKKGRARNVSELAKTIRTVEILSIALQDALRDKYSRRQTHNMVGLAYLNADKQDDVSGTAEISDTMTMTAISQQELEEHVNSPRISEAVRYMLARLDDTTDETYKNNIESMLRFSQSDGELGTSPEYNIFASGQYVDTKKSKATFDNEMQSIQNIFVDRFYKNKEVGKVKSVSIDNVMTDGTLKTALGNLMIRREIERLFLNMVSDPSSIKSIIDGVVNKTEDTSVYNIFNIVFGGSAEGIKLQGMISSMVGQRALISKTLSSKISDMTGFILNHINGEKKQKNSKKNPIVDQNDIMQQVRSQKSGNVNMDTVLALKYTNPRGHETSLNVTIGELMTVFLGNQDNKKILARKTMGRGTDKTPIIKSEEVPERIEVIDEIVSRVFPTDNDGFGAKLQSMHKELNELYVKYLISAGIMNHQMYTNQVTEFVPIYKKSSTIDEISPTGSIIISQQELSSAQYSRDSTKEVSDEDLRSIETDYIKLNHMHAGKLLKKHFDEPIVHNFAIALENVIDYNTAIKNNILEGKVIPGIGEVRELVRDIQGALIHSMRGYPASPKEVQHIQDKFSHFKSLKFLMGLGSGVNTLSSLFFAHARKVNKGKVSIAAKTNAWNNTTPEQKNELREVAQQLSSPFEDTYRANRFQTRIGDRLDKMSLNFQSFPGFVGSLIARHIMKNTYKESIAHGKTHEEAVGDATTVYSTTQPAFNSYAKPATSQQNVYKLNKTFAQQSIKMRDLIINHKALSKITGKGEAGNLAAIITGMVAYPVLRTLRPTSIATTLLFSGAFNPALVLGTMGTVTFLRNFVQSNLPVVLKKNTDTFGSGANVNTAWLDSYFRVFSTALGVGSRIATGTFDPSSILYTLALLRKPLLSMFYTMYGTEVTDIDQQNNDADAIIKTFVSFTDSTEEEVEANKIKRN